MQGNTRYSLYAGSIAGFVRAIRLLVLPNAPVVVEWIFT
jgi:hypothetical protein